MRSIQNDTQHFEILCALKRIEAHPFNLIGLSDREKFHTGMLAFLLETLKTHAPALYKELLTKIWGEECSRELCNDTEIRVEHNGIDLCILKNEDITHWAEVKLKTGLVDNQISRYSAKAPGAFGALIGLFPEDSNHALPFFPFGKIVRFFEKHVTRIDGIEEIGSDRNVLLRLWVTYLGDLSKIADHFVELELSAVTSQEKITNLKKELKKIKILGIFERYRYQKVLSKITQNFGPTEPAAREEWKLFNSRGNSGLHIEFKAKFHFGLQWQAKALKLFAELPNEITEKTSSERDLFLDQLLKDFQSQFPRTDSRLNRNGKFRSYTVDRWEIFGDCTEKVQKLTDYLQHLQAQCALGAYHQAPA